MKKILCLSIINQIAKYVPNSSDAMCNISYLKLLNKIATTLESVLPGLIIISNLHIDLTIVTPSSVKCMSCKKKSTFVSVFKS